MRNGVAWEHFTETLTSGSDLKAGEEGALVASGKRVLRAEGTGCAKVLGGRGVQGRAWLSLEW